nr:retrovirus-related Pol polyprotein from transposon TNT 1-94 [Tanacetum cinerariifolium]
MIIPVLLVRKENNTEHLGIKREFSVPRTPQQNGIAERKNQTLIEAARTMLTDSLLPIPFWAETVNTACYVQNRVLLTKPYNKTPYELLHGRTPSIGFMRPFGCPVTILNTLDHLGKFQRKVDEGFLVGYSVCSKAFRVSNSRTRIFQETLHVNFLENKPNVAGTGPTWLFDIDSLSGTINYHPVFVENQPNSGAGFQYTFDAEKAGEEVTQTYVFFPVWSAGSTNPQNNDKDALVDGNEHDVDTQKSESAVLHSSSSSAQTKKQVDKTERKNKGNSPVESFTGSRDLNAEFNECSNNNSNRVNAASSIVPTVGHNFINNTNVFSAAGPSNIAVSSTYKKSSFTAASTSSHNPDMPDLEDLAYSDDEDVVGAEADINNLEFSIPVSPIPTTRIHKDHHILQIIGDLSSTTQTRSMARAVKDQADERQVSDEFYRRTHILFRSSGKQEKDGIFISQNKYVAEILRKFGLTKGKSASTSIDTEKPLLKDPDGKDVDLHTYRLISWQCKKQTVVATSSTEAKYVAAASGCQVQFKYGVSSEVKGANGRRREQRNESINETPAQKAAKRIKLSEKVKEVKDLKQHPEIMPDEDDDVYTEATPLARKVPIVDYQIVLLNNKPRYKIIRVDGTHQLYSQRSVHGQAMVKSWKLLTSCGVHIISFTTTQLILLVERRYPLSKFTLDQMLNAVRLQVEEQSEMSLELLSFGVDAAMEFEEKNTKCVNAAGEELSAVKRKLMLLDTGAERRLMLLSQVKTVNEKCCC